MVGRHDEHVALGLELERAYLFNNLGLVTSRLGRFEEAVALVDALLTLVRRFSVFVGGWTIDAAEQICADGLGDVLGVLTTLVDQSLVRQDREQALIAALDELTANGHVALPVLPEDVAFPPLAPADAEQWVEAARAQSPAIALARLGFRVKLMAGGIAGWLLGYPSLPAFDLVYGGATKVKQYVFESARLPEIRGASALLWGRDAALMAAMADRRANPTYLPDVTFPRNHHLPRSARALNQPRFWSSTRNAPLGPLKRS